MGVCGAEAWVEGEWRAWAMERDEAKRLSIYLARHGSHAYGLATPTSDEDFKGVMVLPPSGLLGSGAPMEQFDEHEPDDLVMYSLQKFVRLASECNPSIIEVLYVDEGDILHMEEEGRLLREKRDIFLSVRAFQSFTGYAMSQLNRIKTHRGWLLEPPKGEPTREEFGLPPMPTLPKSQLGAAAAIIDRQGASGFDTNFLDMLDREKRWRSALEHWKQFKQWKQNRNVARAELEAKYGYDCKHGSHLIRLLRMGEEILTRGEVLVKRPDGEELRAIRAGAWSYDRLLEESGGTMRRLQALSQEQAAVPQEPDMAAIEALCVELTLRAWRRRGVV